MNQSNENQHSVAPDGWSKVPVRQNQHRQENKRQQEKKPQKEKNISRRVVTVAASTVATSTTTATSAASTTSTTKQSEKQNGSKKQVKKILQNNRKVILQKKQVHQRTNNSNGSRHHAKAKNPQNTKQIHNNDDRKNYRRGDTKSKNGYDISDFPPLGGGSATSSSLNGNDNVIRNSKDDIVNSSPSMISSPTLPPPQSQQVLPSESSPVNNFAHAPRSRTPWSTTTTTTTTTTTATTNISNASNNKRRINQNNIPTPSKKKNINNKNNNAISIQAFSKSIQKPNLPSMHHHDIDTKKKIQKKSKSKTPKTTIVLPFEKKSVVNFDIKKSNDTTKQSQPQQNTSHLDSNNNNIFALHQENMISFNIGGGKAAIIPGKQKIKDRKKRLTPLKKQVLKERLEQWKEKSKAQEQNNKEQKNGSSLSITTGSSSSSGNPSPIVYLRGYIQQDEALNDDDEYEEIQSDLKDMSTKIGALHSLLIPRNATDTKNRLSFVRFANVDDADTAKNCWNGMVISGCQIKVGIVSKQALIKAWNDANSNGDDTADDDSDKHYNLCLEKWQEIVMNKAMVDFELDCQETANKGVVVALGNILTEDDFEDEACMEESLGDIKKLASQHGALLEDGGIQVDMESLAVHITYKDGHNAAIKAVDQLDGIVIAGQIVSAKLLDDTNESKNTNEDRTSIIYLDGYLEKGEEIDDDDEFDEIAADLKVMAEKVGTVVGQFIPRDASNDVCFVQFQNEPDASTSKDAWNGLVIGGSTIKVGIVSKTLLQTNIEADALQLDKHVLFLQKFLETNELSRLDCQGNNSQVSTTTITIANILTQDDFEDEGCMEESLVDIQMLASQYGDICKDAVSVNYDTQEVRVQYSGGIDVASSAALKLNGLVIGGQTILAKVDSHNSNTTDKSIPVATKTAESTPGPMYSGDKIIPEQYAECKRVPKIPNSGKPRSYASLLGNDEAIPLLHEMLGELMRLQLRSKDDKNANARRRLVMGLREVARGIRANKVKMIVCANNLDQYGVIDEKIQAIIDSAAEKDIPIIYELNKRKIGKALGKSIKVSIVAIQNADGAQVQFKKLKKMYHYST